MALGFIDISRAFAIINHAYLLKACHKLGLREIWIALLFRELELQRIDLFCNGASLGTIRMERWLIEGIPTSSLLLGIYLITFWRTLRANPTYCENVMVFPAYRDSRAVTSHAAGWVDDWVVAFRSPQGLAAILNLCVNMFDTLGMCIAFDKTQWINVAYDAPTVGIYVAGRWFKASESVVYLGASISCAGALGHLDFRCRRMMASWGRLQNALRKIGASQELMVKAANLVALPTLLWALSVFSITGNIIL